MKQNSRLLIPLLAVTAATSYLVAQDKEAEKASPSLVITSDSRPIERLGGSHPTSYAPMLETARRSVVTVYTSEVVRFAQRSNSQRDEMLRRFLGQGGSRGFGDGVVREQEVPQGVGSGVIVSPDGYIVTNNHVVSDSRGGDADKILVRLSDDTEMEATLVGRDPSTDIAVIKVMGEKLPTAKIADSDQVKVGDIVFAIGNPLDVGLTVTSGIVSATGRSIGIYGRNGYEDFIQTDASVNRGNSGGALVDIEGRLIGINSAIKSESGGSIGIGFAIPTNLATNIAKQLTDSGEVQRGLIGVEISPLSPQIAEAMGAKGIRGVLIERVEKGFPAEKAGLRHGDIITSVDGRGVIDISDLRLAILRVESGKSLSVVAFRDGELLTVEMEVANPTRAVAMGGNFIEGIEASSLNNELRQSFGIPRNLSGLVITKAEPTSPFRRYLMPGLVIMEINKRPVSSLAEARKALHREGNNLLYVYIEGRTSYFALSLN